MKRVLLWGSMRRRGNQGEASYLSVLMALLVLPTAFSSCTRVKVEAPEASATPEVPASQPAPTVALRPAAAPVVQHLAPEGVYFLLSPASVVTDEGITGLRPGTRVLKVGVGRYTAEGHSLELAAHQVTNDLQIAARVAGADQAAQAAIRQSAQAAAVRPIQISQVPVQPSSVEVIPVPSAVPAPSARVNPLDAPAKRVNPEFDQAGRRIYRGRIH